MNRVPLILAMTFGVMLNAQAQSILATSTPHQELWGSTHKQLKKKGFRKDASDPILSLEQYAMRIGTALASNKKLSVMSKRTKSIHLQDMQTALFFEDRLARFKHTVVFKEKAFDSIQEKVRALEILLDGKPSVLTEALELRKSGSWRYESEEGVYKVSILLDSPQAGGILKIEGAWAPILSTLKQYERHLIANVDSR